MGGMGIEEASETKWIVPRVGVSGTIRWGGNTHLCMTATQDEKLELRVCENADVQRSRWEVDNQGFIRMTYQKDKCLDISDHENAAYNDGIRVTLATCQAPSEANDTSPFYTAPETMLFDIVAYDCKWMEWSDWSGCFATCGASTQYRAREVASEAKNGGEDCNGDFSMQGDCPGLKECPDGGKVRAIGDMDGVVQHNWSFKPPPENDNTWLGTLTTTTKTSTVTSTTASTSSFLPAAGITACTLWASVSRLA